MRAVHVGGPALAINLQRQAAVAPRRWRRARAPGAHTAPGRPSAKVTRCPPMVMPEAVGVQIVGVAPGVAPGVASHSSPEGTVVTGMMLAREGA